MGVSMGVVMGVVSLDSDLMDEEGRSPLHIASSEGHTAIIVALVEEGRADVNLQGGDKKDTPLMLSVS